MSKGVSLAREELLRTIAILENIEKLKVEPFSVNIANLLERLRRILEESKDLETIVLDAETLYKIAVVLVVQHRWIREKTTSLFLDSQLIRALVSYSSPEALVNALLKAWRPMVRIEQVTLLHLLKGYDHFLSLPNRGERSGIEGEAAQLQLELQKQFVEEGKEMKESMEALKSELAGLGDEWVDYWDFVKRGDLKETFERAYLLSHLISRGEVEVMVNPLTREVRIRVNRSGKEEKRDTSLVMTFGGEKV